MRILRRPSPGVVIAIFALVIALGGTAFAGQHAPSSTGLRWTRLTLTNGWSAYGAGSRAPAVAIDSSGIVHFKGAMMTSGSDFYPFVLPSAYRPSGTVLVSVSTVNTTFGRLYIQHNGTVSVEAETDFANAAAFTSLDGASFAK